jgi:outer membrane protein OmpA-like peptidoglycan-associated protein
MADGYSWSELRDGGTYRLPGPEHLGWWSAVAMLVSILLHIGVFFVLNRMKIALHFEQARELSTANINIRPVQVQPMDNEQAAPPDEVVTPPKDSATLLEEVDMLAALPKNQPIDIKPEVKEAEYALQMKQPAMTGDPAAVAMEVSAGMEVDAELPELGRQPERLKPAEAGQVTVDPGAVPFEDNELGKFTEDLIKRGANGKVDKGTLHGIASLDDLLDLPPNILVGKKTMLPSDLLFEYNSSELRESAKVGLMKLALLMDRNPNLYCWIEGHTDLIGGDDFNLDLSVRRSEAVKNYLIKSLRMDASKISTRGYGRFAPLVTHGTSVEQAINRRVEIRMRNTPPPKDQLKITPQKAPVAEATPTPNPVVEATPAAKPVAETPPPAAKPVAETPPPAAMPVVESPPTPKAVLVKPKRALPVDEEEEIVPPRATPRAQPVEE